MDFRSPVLPTAGGPLQPLFPPPGPLAHPPHSQAGMFLYPGLSSPVKPPPLHILPSHKLEHRSTATVPPLLHTPVTASPTANSETTHTSSFAAALKSLARNACGSDGRDSSSKALEGGTHSPKRPHASRLADQATGGPPVVTIAPTTTRQRQDVSIVAGEPRKSSAEVHMRASGVLTAASLAPPITSTGDLCKSGFQPYRAVSAAEDHRAMMDAAAMYSAAAAAAAGGFPSSAAAAAALYSVHPAQHNIYSSRLEEQLYLERLGLLRPSALGMAGAGYPPVSAFPHMLSPAQYPPELMHSPLYMSQSLYLQERLKLEEDARRRLECERDRSRASSRTPISTGPVSGRVRSPMTSQAKSHSPVTSQRSVVKRERSPLTTSALSTAATTATWAAEQRSPLTSAALTLATPGRERSPLRAVAADLRVSPAEQRAEPVVRENPSVYRPYLPSPSRPCVRDSSRNPLDLSRESSGISPAGSNDVLTNGLRRTSSDSSEGFRPPYKKTTVVRPFEDKPQQSNGALRHGLPHAAEQNDPLNLCSGYPASLPGQERKPKIEPVGADTKDIKPTIQFAAVIPPRVEDRRSSTSASAASSAPMDLSGARRPSTTSPEPTRRVTSRLDRREQRLRQGQEDPESPPVGPLHVLTGPPCQPETSPEKLDFLSHVGLTTPCRKNDVELQKCERHVALHRPVTSPISAHQMTASRRSPADMTSPPAQLTAALNRTPDLVAKRLFLDAIGLTPSGGQPKQAVAAVTASRVRERVSPSLPPGKAASPPVGASKSAVSRRARIIPYSRPSAPARRTPSSPDTVVPPSAEAMEPPVLKLPGPAAWSGPQTITAIYTHYAKERALALEQTRQSGERLKTQHRELEETSRTLSLRMNAAVATRSQLTRQRDQLQEKMALLVSTLQRLQSPLR